MKIKECYDVTKPLLILARTTFLPPVHLLCSRPPSPSPVVVMFTLPLNSLSLKVRGDIVLLASRCNWYQEKKANIWRGPLAKSPRIEGWRGERMTKRLILPMLERRACPVLLIKQKV